MNLFIFTTDLRLNDNYNLFKASKNETIYVYLDDNSMEEFRSVIYDALKEIRVALQLCGNDLYYIRGGIDKIYKLCNELPIEAIYTKDDSSYVELCSRLGIEMCNFITTMITPYPTILPLNDNVKFVMGTIGTVFESTTVMNICGNRNFSINLLVDIINKKVYIGMIAYFIKFGIFSAEELFFITHSITIKEYSLMILNKKPILYAYYIKDKGVYQKIIDILADNKYIDEIYQLVLNHHLLHSPETSKSSFINYLGVVSDNDLVRYITNKQIHELLRSFSGKEKKIVITFLRNYINF